MTDYDQSHPHDDGDGVAFDSSEHIERMLAQNGRDLCILRRGLELESSRRAAQEVKISDMGRQIADAADELSHVAAGQRELAEILRRGCASQ